MTDVNNRLIWLNGEMVNVNNARINVLAPTAQFGANVFEGIRCYWNEEQQKMYAFRLEDHYDRLLNSMRMFKMEMKYTKEHFKAALVKAIRANNYREDIAVRQTVYIDGFGSWYANGPLGMFVAPIPKGRTLPDGKKGYKACISSWERISDKSMSPRVKVGANYINSRMAQLEAINNGYDTAVFMNNQGKISEAPGSCIFIVKDNTLITPLLTDSILTSITRDTVIRLAKEINITVIERSVDRTELYIADEIFLCGSAMEIVPIVSIDGFVVPNTAITNTLQELYLKLVTNRITLESNWVSEI